MIFATSRKSVKRRGSPSHSSLRPSKRTKVVDNQPGNVNNNVTNLDLTTQLVDNERLSRKAKWAKLAASVSKETPNPEESLENNINIENKNSLDIKSINAQESNPSENSISTNSPLLEDTATQSIDSSKSQISQESKSKPNNGLDMFSDDVGEAVIEQTTILRKGVDVSDDQEGYYRTQLGEVLGGRYRIYGNFGKGTFSNVLRAKDLVNDVDVAIKLLRNNDYMKRTGLGEVKFVELLTSTDPDNKFNTIRLLNHFIDREHLCLVFEAMDMDLRDLINKYGKKVGLGMDAVRVMGRKIIKALYHLKSNGIVHADLKPQNMLINQDRSEVKVADLGSAFMITDEIIETPLLVSRFYRAPEIILGLKYGYPIDMFAYGSCLYEFATGEPLLRSKDNNDHLKLIMEIKGMVPKKMLTKGKFVNEHFDEKNYFLERSIDTVLNKEIVLPRLITKPTRNILIEIEDKFPNPTKEEKELIKHLADLIEKCLIINPAKRITPEEALIHPFYKWSSTPTTNNTNTTTQPENSS